MFLQVSNVTQDLLLWYRSSGPVIHKYSDFTLTLVIKKSRLKNHSFSELFCDWAQLCCMFVWLLFLLSGNVSSSFGKLVKKDNSCDFCYYKPNCKLVEHISE